MGWRAQLPLYIVGTLGTMTAGLGLGFGLGQYTISGMDPFVSMARTVSYREPARDNEFASARFADASRNSARVFDPAKPAY